MKRVVAGVIFGLAFAFNVMMVYGLSPLSVRQDWLNMVMAMGVQPLSGTQFLLDTLAFWWIYPAFGAFVFGVGFIYLKRSLVPCLIMLGITALWLVYFYAPLLEVGLLA